MTEWWVWKRDDLVLHMTYAAKPTSLFIPTRMYCGARIPAGPDRIWLLITSKMVAGKKLSADLSDHTPCYDCLEKRAELR